MPVAALWAKLASGVQTEADVRRLFQSRQNSRGSNDAPLQIERAWPVMNEAMLRRFDSSGSLDINVDHGSQTMLGQHVHDTFLFHGTKAQFFANIEAEGLSLHHAQNGMLGRGVYGAPDPRKSMQYMDDRTAQGLRRGPFMFLCRFNLRGAQHAGPSTHHRNSVYDEFCVYSDVQVVVLWAMKLR